MRVRKRSNKITELSDAIVNWVTKQAFHQLTHPVGK